MSDINTLQAGGLFPSNLVSDMMTKVQGHSTIAKLANQSPMPFTGTTEFIFNLDGEVNLVGEGDAKPAGKGTITPKVIKPLKFVYQMRVSDEFIKSGDETRLKYLTTFTDGFAKKMGRGIDLAAIHGVNPATLTDASFKSTNSFDGLVTNVITYDATAVDDCIDEAVQAIENDVTGLALSKTAGSDLAKIKVNGVVQYPEFRFGQNPDAFYGMTSDINTTVSAVNDDEALVGDFANAFKWGYAANIPLEIIQYGDPDGAGRDLKRYNEVLLRAEAFIGWGILDKDAFGILRSE